MDLSAQGIKKCIILPAKDNGYVYYACVGIQYTLCIVGLEPWIRVGDGA